MTRVNKFSDEVAHKDIYNMTELLESKPKDGLEVEVLNERVDKTSSVFELEYTYGGGGSYGEYFSVSDRVESFNSTSISQNLYVTNYAYINYDIN